MAGLADIFGSGGGAFDLYGDMLTPQQKQALAFRGLMSAAGALGQAAMPSRMPVPIGAALGQAAGAMAQGQDEGAMSALRASLVGLQGQQLKSQLAIRDKLMGILPSLIGGDTAGGTPSSVPTTTPSTAAPADVVVPSSGGQGGWGPLATPAIDTLTSLGHSPAAIQGIMANGLGEGGFNEPWQKAGGSENSFGHWQFNQNGELPGYLAWAQGKGDPKDTKLQAQYVAQRMEQLVPGFSQITDPQQATDLVATKFERYKGAAPGQRYGYLADVQRAMSGQPLEARQPIPVAPGQLAEGALPAVPDFAGMMTGNQGAAYAPQGVLAPPDQVVSAPTRSRPLTAKDITTNFGGPKTQRLSDGTLVSEDDYPYPFAGPAPATPDQSALAAALRARLAQAPAILPIAPASAQSTPIPQIQGPAVAPQITLAQTNPLPGTPSASPIQAAPVFGSLAPQPVAATPSPLIGGMNPRALAAAGVMAQLGGIGDAFKPLESYYYNSPGYKAAIAAAQMGATKPIELQFAAPLAAAGDQGKLPYEGASGAIQAAKLYPVGSPERALADAFAAKTSGISPVIGGERPGVPIQRWNPSTQSYEIIGQVPRMPEGAMTMPGPNGTVTAAPVPGAADIATTMATANAAGPATFKPQTFHGPYGGEYLGTERQLPGMVAGVQPILPQPAPGGGGLAVGGPLAPPPAQATPAAPVAPVPPPTGLQPGGAIQAPTEGQRAESRAPNFPVQTPNGQKDISELSVSDLFPGGQGIPTPPAPPPGMGYGKPNTTLTKMQEADAARAEGYAKEGSENQKVYQDVSHLRDVLGRSLNTNRLAPLWTDLTNIAHGLGADSIIPKQYDPADAATFNKVATDLVFAAVKKMAGQVRVAEIEGYKQANPSLVIPRETNYSIVNDVLATAKWQDARAKLANDYLTSTGGAPLSAFEARFNQAAPLADVTESYKNELRKQGAVFPGDQGQPSAAPEATRTIGGKNYIKMNGQWYLKQ
jgi:hypothetical protein